MSIFPFVIIIFAFTNVQSQTMVLTDETTDVTFVTGHIAGQLQGTFKGVKGSASLDSNNLSGSFLKLAFATSTLLQNDYLVGPNLLRSGCFNTSQFPQIELSSTSILKMPAANRYRFTGTLTVKGITKNITFPFTATPNVGGYDLYFTFPIVKKAFNLHCAVTKQFKITVKGYGKKEDSIFQIPAIPFSLSMQQFIKIFFVGMLVSFLGSLPLGTLNVATMQISITDGYRAAIEFAVGTFIVEMIYVRLSLVAMDKIRKQERVLKILEWVTLFVIVALAAASFVAASKNNAHAKNIVLSNGMPRFLLGLVMSAINPVQVPFWFGWSTVLFTKKILLPQNSHYNMYIAGIGIGTFLASCLFIFGGRLIVEKLNANQNTLNWIIGGIFSVTAVIQLWKMRKKTTE